MSYHNESWSDQMEDVIFEDEDCVPNKNEKKPNVVLPRLTSSTLCEDSQNFVSPATSVYIDHDIVPSGEDPDFCIVNIFKEMNIEEAPRANNNNLGESSRYRAWEESQNKVSPATSSNNSGDSDDEISDMSDLEVEVDLEDILKAERVVRIDEEQERILKRYAKGVYSKKRSNCQGHHTQSSEQNILQTTTAPLYPPGLEVPAGPLRPQSPSNLSLHFSDTDDEESDEDGPRWECIPKINGVEVGMYEVELTPAEIELYSDPSLGEWRAKSISPLRMCWIPLDNWMTYGSLDGRSD